jgi:uncharacterized protein (TIGR00369 family)
MTAGKRVADSKVTLSELMIPEDTNGLGNVHGGIIMKMVDEAGGIAAMRHARRPSVTVAMDSMTFMEPVRVGMLVTCIAELTYVGRTSMEVRVEVFAEDPLSGVSKRTNTAYLVYVALDEEGHPTPVPALILETNEQRIRAQHAIERQAYRKAQREREDL